MTLRPCQSFFASATVDPATISMWPPRAAFCSSWAKRSGVPIHDSNFFCNRFVRGEFGDVEAMAEFREELARKVRHGVTSMVFTIPDGFHYHYKVGDYDYALPPIPGQWLPDGSGRPARVPNWATLPPDGSFHPQMIRFIDAVLSIMPGVIWYFVGGGQGYDGADAIYDGRLRNMCRAVKRQAGWVKRGGFNWAWESFGANPECTTKQNFDAYEILHEELGPEAVIMMHVGPSHPMRINAASLYRAPEGRIPNDILGRPCVINEAGSFVEVDDPSEGDEIGSHYVEGGRRPAVFSGQWPNGIPTERQLAKYLSHLIYCLDRFLPKGTPIPSVGTAPWRRWDEKDGVWDYTPYAKGPDWFNGLAVGKPHPRRSGGRLTLWMMEPGTAYAVATDPTGTLKDKVRWIHDAIAALGVTTGCMPLGD